MQAHKFPAQITTGVLFLFAQTIMTGEDYPRRLTKMYFHMVTCIILCYDLKTLQLT